MLAPRLIALLIVGAASFAGCSTVDDQFHDEAWYQKTKVVSAKAFNVTQTAAQQAYARMQKYASEQDTLRHFHDASEESEDAVLAELRRSGILKRSVGPVSAPHKHVGVASAGPIDVPEHFAGAFSPPLDAYIISSEFGTRHNRPHKGIDMAADTGEEVHAIGDGVVIYADDKMTGYGNVVILRHDRRYSSLYAHNSALKVKKGDVVKQGQLISLLGSTGHSTGPHVHFEIRDGEVAVNPHTLVAGLKHAQTSEGGTPERVLARLDKPPP